MSYGWWFTIMFWTSIVASIFYALGAAVGRAKTNEEWYEWYYAEGYEDEEAE